MSLWSRFQRWLTKTEEPSSTSHVEDLKLRYREFKYLLRANNEVLAIIADLETRLTEQELVGRHWLDARFAAASAKVFKMILHLDRIAGGAYPGLYSAFDGIRAMIEAELAKSHRPEDDALILSLAQVDLPLADLTGAKAANLAAVGRLGLPGRQGFVITTTAFHDFMEATGLREYILQELTFLEDLSYGHLAAMSHRISRRIMETELPAGLARELDQAMADLLAKFGPDTRFSVRSSAVGEDSEASFAGQYKTMLSVPADQIGPAYREVVASLYEPQAVSYRRRRGWRDEEAEMAVLILAMLKPRAAGVLYTRDPRPGKADHVLINAVFGLGRGLVEGELTPDVFVVRREPGPALIDQVITDKKSRLVARGDELVMEPLSPEESRQPALTPAQAERLAVLGLKLEKGFGGPQDVEWSLMPDDQIVILQSRPLQLTKEIEIREEKQHLDAHLLYSGGETARPGAASGPVYFVLRESDLDGFPPGAVLCAPKSSPVFGCVLDQAAAVLTEVGGVTGHMASLAREYGLPAIVGAEGVLSRLTAGDIITVDATFKRVFLGRVEEVLKKEAAQCPTCAATLGRPGRHPILGLIANLTLTNPRHPDFRPENCRTFHDIIRFVHEKSFKEMFRLGDRLGHAAESEARRFGPSLPFELWIIDIGGGLAPQGNGPVAPDQVRSLPARYFLEGLLDERIHWNQPRPVSLRGLVSVFSGAVLHPDAEGQEREFGRKAYAIFSSEYMNFNSRVGYHFAALDSVCGPVQNDNYISFRFQGGAAAAERRALRAELISTLLARQGFDINHRGDMVHAFVKKYDQKEIGRRLADLGRLTLFTRQMDMLTHDRRMVAWLVQAFESGNYNLETMPPPKTAQGAL